MAAMNDPSPEALGFVHRYLPPAEPAGAVGDMTLLLLHGTGGDEEDLLPLGRLLFPGAGMLSPRGQAVENGMRRFFRRHGVGVLDQEDLRQRTDELADFIDQSAEVYDFERAGVVAVGFSNGANIATSLLLRRGPVLRAAVLLSPMLPFEPDELPDLAGVAVFIGAGRRDPYAPVAQVERLAALLESAGAEVTVHWEPGGHALTRSEIDAAHRWLTAVIQAHG
jgi:predicted esterase